MKRQTYAIKRQPTLSQLIQQTSSLIGNRNFQIRTSRDGSKTQVVRQYGCNTSSAGEPNQTMTYQQKSFVYINGAKVIQFDLQFCSETVVCLLSIIVNNKNSCVFKKNSIFCLLKYILVVEFHHLMSKLVSNSNHNP